MNKYNYLDIINIDKKGIFFSDKTFIDFEECRREWASINNIPISETVCVASRFCGRNECYFIFYTHERIKLLFSFNGIMKKKKMRDKFKEIQEFLNRCGYSSYDMT